MLGLVPVGSAPIGILSLSIRNVANRDLEVDGWRSGATGALEAGNISLGKTQFFQSPEVGQLTSHSILVSAPGPLQTLVVYITTNATTQVVQSLSDTGGGTWIQEIPDALGKSFYRRVGGSTTGTITISFISTINVTQAYIRTFYLDGASQTLTVDSIASGSSGYSSTVSIPITTTSSNAFVIAAIARSGAGAPLITSISPTERLELKNDAQLSQFLLLRNAGTAGSKTLTGTWEPSGYTWQVIAYRPVQTSAVLADNLDEDTPDNSDYSYSSNLDDRQTPLVMALNNPLEAGTYTFNFTAQKDLEWGEVKLTLLDSNLTSVGSSSWTGLVDRTFNTYSVTATTTATSAYIKVEARSDASLVVDFTDPDKINPLVKNYSNSIPGQAESMNGMYVDKYGFLTSNWTNFLYNSSRLNQLRNFTGATAVLDVEYAPDLSFTADKLVEDTSTGEHFVRNSNTTVTLTANRVVTYSVRLKPAGRQHCRVSFTAGSDFSAVFTLTGAGAISSATNLEKSSITALSNSWYLCTITFINTALTTNAQAIIKLQSNSTTTSYTGNGTSGVFVWGQQAQYGWNPTSFDSDPTLQDYGYSWRIAHGTEYKYLSNNLIPNYVPGTRLDNVGSPQNATFSSVGIELQVNCTSSVNNAQFTLDSPTTFYKKGSCYEIKNTTRADAKSNGAASIYWIGRSNTSMGFVGSNTTSSNIGLLSVTNGYNSTTVHTFAFYNKGSGLSLGDIGGVQETTIREVQRKALGLPIEQYCGNSLIWSTDLTNTSWTAVGLAPVINYTDRVSPSGDYDPWDLVETGGFGPHYISQNINFTQGTTAVLSVFFNSGTIQLRADDAVGGYWANFVHNGPYSYVGNKDTTSTSAVEYVNNSWCRCSLTFVPTVTGTYPVYIQVVPGSSSAKNASFTPTLYPTRMIWGPQVDHTNTGGQFKPSLYKPTTNSISYATNVYPSVDFSPDWYTPGTPFTVYIEYGICGRNYGGIWGVAEASGSVNTIFMVYGFGSTKLTVGLTNTPAVNLRSTNDFDYTIMNRIAVRFEPGNYAIHLNGTLTTFSDTNPIPTTWTKMIMGNTWTQGQGGNGHFKRLKFYPRALNDGELLNLTAGDGDQNAGLNLLTTSW